jgi:acetolactate synthase-1/2/3 large subunit
MFAPDGRPLGVRQVGVQEVDIVAIVRSITKYAVTVDDPASIRYHMERALHLARCGRPGPVWIDIPLDVQATQVDIAAQTPFDAATCVCAGESGDIAADVRAAIDRLNAAERPLLLLGNGIRLARAEPELAELIRLLDVPVETTWLAIDLIADEHPLFVGRPGSVAPRGANFAVQNADYLLAIGARLDRVVTGFAPENFARNARKTMVDIDPAELDKMGETVDQPVLADAGAFIREMLRQRARIASRDRSPWKQRCAHWKARYPVVHDEHRHPSGPVSVYHFAEVLGEELAAGDFIVSGSSGSGIELFLLALAVKPRQRIFHTTALGAMGFGIAASIGVSLAGGRKRTVCVDGDGGFQFNIQELETVRRLGLPIVFFVLNNGGYASIRASQTSFFGAPSIGCDDATGQSLPDVTRIATAYGISIERIDDQTTLREDIRRVLRSPGPVVCDVHMIADEVRAPRLSSAQLPDGSFVSKPLEDLWPFLDRVEFDENMRDPVA